MTNCVPQSVAYGAVVALKLDCTIDGNRTFVGCQAGGNGSPNLATATISGMTGSMTSWKVMPGTNNQAADKTNVKYGDVVKLVQTSGGSDCGSGNYLGLQSNSSLARRLRATTPMLVMAPSNGQVITDAVFQPGTGVTIQEVKYGDPVLFTFALNGTTYWVGVGQQDLEAQTSVSDAVNIRFTSGVSPYQDPPPICPASACYASGSSCYDLKPNLCPDVSNPNLCGSDQSQAACRIDSTTGNPVYTCPAPDKCYVEGSHCNDVAAAICPDPNNPDNCVDGSRAKCQMDSQGVPQYSCPAVNLCFTDGHSCYEVSPTICPNQSNPNACANGATPTCQMGSDGQPKYTCQTTGGCFATGSTCHDINPLLCPSSTAPNTCQATGRQAKCQTNGNGTPTYTCPTEECFATGSTCFDKAPALCPSSADPNTCVGGQQATCILDTLGQVSYSCPGPGQCYATGSTCHDIAPKICTKSEAPNICTKTGQRAACQINTNGAPSYSCPGSTKFTPLQIGLIVAGSVLGLALVALIIYSATAGKHKREAKTTNNPAVRRAFSTHTSSPHF